MSLIDIGQVLAENAALTIRILELEKLIEKVRYERDSAEREAFNVKWKLDEAEATLQDIEEMEEEMRRDGLLIDPLKPNWKQQVRLINERERRELESN
jgi:hypothetical protein